MEPLCMLWPRGSRSGRFTVGKGHVTRRPSEQRSQFWREGVQENALTAVEF
jgi:hypothetical protein